ncbi:pyridoxal phosphate-dependent aminotransferase [Nonomuraea typhae]|uniref:Pyridoxal phosphate-dependent aminotransferase n=1 Tax=Nonomuraea typhae TaxID=2603600 RepID=A0ABW7Z723_9ACTN
MSSCHDTKTTCVGVMDDAHALERAGHDVIHMEKGEPDFASPEVVVEAAVEALRAGKTFYTDSSGLPELRAAISEHLQVSDGVDVPPSRILINSGSSPALLSVFLATCGPGDEVVLPDPAYPSYRRLIELAGAKPVFVPTREHGFRFTAELAAPHVRAATRAVLINFPSNPVGATATAGQLRAFAELGPPVISDEVYRGLSYTGAPDPGILQVRPDAIMLNSFSKAFTMTGWRLGFTVVPEALLARMKTIQQDGFVCANAFVQWAAIAAVRNADKIVSGPRAEFARRRDTLLAGLTELGFAVPHPPSGAFYVFARLPDGHHDAYAFAAGLLRTAHVAITPGPEFGAEGAGFVRFSYSTPAERIGEGLRRIRAFLTQPDSSRR